MNNIETAEEAEKFAAEMAILVCEKTRSATNMAVLQIHIFRTFLTQLRLVGENVYEIPRFLLLDENEVSCRVIAPLRKIIEGLLASGLYGDTINEAIERLVCKELLRQTENK